MDEECYKKLLRANSWRDLVWSNSEIHYEKRDEIRKPIFKKNPVPLSLILNITLRNSCFGNFLQDYNKYFQQKKSINENKFIIDCYNYKKSNEEEKTQWKSTNGFTDKPFFILKNLIHTEDEIDIAKLKNKLLTLRLTDCQMNTLDDSLKSFKNIGVLILSGNFLEEFLGKLLPKSVKFLELYVNCIKDLKCIQDKARLTLFHLGLGRNKLTNNSSLHLLSTSRTFRQLHTLDLSCNDIYDLVPTLAPLQGLKELRALSLEGNPCSMCYSYKDVVVSHLPKLVFLDNTEILPEDRVGEELVTEGTDNGALTFTCYRVIGLPPPPKEKKVTHSFYFEICVPLLEIIKLPIEEEDFIKDEPVGKKGKKGKKDKKEKKPKKEKKSKKGKESKNPYAKPDEYSELFEENLICYKTERQSYNKKFLKFKEPSVIAESPEKNLRALRDTFKSKVNIRLIYIKTCKPPKEKKKKGKKGKKDKNKDKKGKKGSKGDKSTKGTTPVVPQRPKKTEIVLKKITLANINCNLHTVNWSENFQDFYWADVPECKDDAQTIIGSLKDIPYSNKGKKGGKGGKEGKSKKGSEKGDKGKKGKDKKSKSGKSGKGGKSEKSGKNAFPNVLTVQVGFGLQRNPAILNEKREMILDTKEKLELNEKVDKEEEDKKKVKVDDKKGKGKKGKKEKSKKK